MQRAENSERLSLLETDPVRAQGGIDFAARYRADAAAANLPAADAGQRDKINVPTNPQNCKE